MMRTRSAWAVCGCLLALKTALPVTGDDKAGKEGDGIPDAWERAHGLDFGDAADATKVVPARASKNDRHQGYTDIEFFFNELADGLAPKGAIADPSSRRRDRVKGVSCPECACGPAGGAVHSP